ncbi:MAG TPA: DUF951 domain-containing protein [Dehalococcoidia bacterium]|jgi:hypothetical protein|nr:DUF951 domain-containing protein [Dehalococcoidia bacterium]HAS27762.1 DUF951 domain-containing protein [Dehalococcoidia bacterium]
MVMEITPGDIVQLKKKHPCGSDRWQVVRTGADIGIICLGCRHKVILDRSSFEKRVKAVISKI